MLTIIKFFFTVFMLTGALLFGTALLGTAQAEATVIIPDTLVRDKCPHKPGIQIQYRCLYNGGWYR